MKKIVMILCILSVASGLWGAVFAVDGGSVYFSGEAYYEKGFGEAYDHDGVVFAPGFHWFVLRRLSLGVDAHIEKFSSGSHDYSAFSGYLMVNYFMGRKTGLIFPYIGAGVGGGKRSYAAVDYSFAGLKINAGVCFLLNDYIGLKAVASYTVDTVKSDYFSSDRSGGSLRIGVGVVLFIF